MCHSVGWALIPLESERTEMAELRLQVKVEGDPIELMGLQTDLKTKQIDFEEVTQEYEFTIESVELVNN